MRVIRHVDLLPYDSQLRTYNHWQPFHTERNPTPGWLAAWEALIPCGFCLENYLRIKAANPPRFNDWFPWTVEIHNSVNAHLSPPKPLLSVDEAKAIWIGTE